MTTTTELGWTRSQPDPTQAVANLLHRAQDQARDEATHCELDLARRRLAEPLRLAIAGMVKAGKSTLVNALLGERVAATDAAECTRIVTWYRHGASAAVDLHLADGRVLPAAWTRTERTLSIDLAGFGAAEVDHLEVRWPSPSLRDLTVIDTPGVASISTDVSARTYDALSAEPAKASTADAVVYLLRHLHAGDVGFLEAFHDHDLAFGTPVNTVGVLSRADEIGSCRLDAMEVAGAIAARYEADPRLQRLCPIVVPMDGALAYAAEQLSPTEHRLFAALAALSTKETDALLLSADRFVTRSLSVAISAAERELVLDRFGLYGVRLAVHLLRIGRVRDAVGLRSALIRSSGLPALRQVLLLQFLDRSRLLRTRSALASLEGVLRAGGCVDEESLRRAVERVVSSNHGLAELRMLALLRTGALELRLDRALELERIVGGSGSEPSSRLGLPPDSDETAIRLTAIAALSRWRAAAGHPLANRSTQLAAATAVRSLEGLLTPIY